MADMTNPNLSAIRSPSEVLALAEIIRSELEQYKTAAETAKQGIKDGNGLIANGNAGGVLNQPKFQESVLAPYSEGAGHLKNAIVQWKQLLELPVDSGLDPAVKTGVENARNLALSETGTSLDKQLKPDFAKLKADVEKLRYDASSGYFSNRWAPVLDSASVKIPDEIEKHQGTDLLDSLPKSRQVQGQPVSPGGVQPQVQPGGVQPQVQPGGVQPQVRPGGVRQPGPLFDRTRFPAHGTKNDIKTFRKQADVDAGIMDHVFDRQTPQVRKDLQTDGANRKLNDANLQKELYYAGLGAKVGSQRAWQWAANTFGDANAKKAIERVEQVAAGERIESAVADLGAPARHAFNFFLGAKDSSGISDFGESARHANEVLGETGLAVPDGHGRSKGVALPDDLNSRDLLNTPRVGMGT
jgi:hypothetical protein